MILKIESLNNEMKKLIADRTQYKECINTMTQELLNHDNNMVNIELSKSSQEFFPIDNQISFNALLKQETEEQIIHSTLCIHGVKKKIKEISEEKDITNKKIQDVLNKISVTCEIILTEYK